VTGNIRLTELQTKVLHFLVKPVGDFTSRKALAQKFPDKSNPEDPDPRLPEALFALWEHRLMDESPDMKGHYALTMQGRRMQRSLAQAAAKGAEDQGEDFEQQMGGEPDTKAKKAASLAKARQAAAAKRAAAKAATEAAASGANPE
jgi:hypothetical protein